MPYRLMLCLGLLSLAGFVLVWMMTASFGLGISTDSVAYLQGADHIAAGKGFVFYDRSAQLIPCSWFPPGFSALLSLAPWVGGDAELWGRFLNACFFGMGIFLTGGIIWNITSSLLLSILSGLMFASSVHLLELHGLLLSEPAFLFLELLFFYLVSFYQRQPKWRFLLLAAGIAGLSACVRYAGLPLIIAGAVWLYLIPKRQGYQGVLAFCTAAGLLPLICFIRNTRLTGELAGSVPHRDWPEGWRLRGLFDSFSEFVMPSSVPDFLRWLAAFVALAAVLWLFCRTYRRCRPQGNVLFLFMLFVFVYILSGVYTISFARIDFEFTHRLLAPIYVVVILWVGLSGVSFLKARVRSQRIFLSVVCFFIAAGILRCSQTAGSFYAEGNGYASRGLRQSGLLSAIRKIGPDVPVYSNRPDEFYYLTGRPALRIPLKESDSAYFPSTEVFERDFYARQGRVIIFYAYWFQPEAFWNKIQSSMGLKCIFKDNFGEIYGVNNNE